MTDAHKHAPRGRIKATAADLMGEKDPKGDRAGRCTARSKSRGDHCRRYAIPGGTVCRYHGGAAPQVMLKARERLEAYQNKAIDRLFQLAEQTAFPSTALTAVRDVLDRTMGKPIETVNGDVAVDVRIFHEVGE